MKKSLLSALLFFSGCSFFVLISPANYFALFYAVLLGAAAGVFLRRLSPDYPKFDRSRSSLISLLLTLLILLLGVLCFNYSWDLSDHLTVAELLNRFFPDAGVVFKLLSVLMAVVASPFVFLIASKTVSAAVRLAKADKLLHWKKLFLRTAQGGKKLLKASGFCAVNILAAALAGLLLLTAVYSLPVDRIRENEKSVTDIAVKYGAYPVIFPWCTSYLDGYTDLLMLQEAATDTGKPALEQAILVEHGTAVLPYFEEGQESETTDAYPRYWHGYQILLKPLLECMDYRSIRILNGIAQAALVAFVCCLLKKRGMSPYILPCLISYLMLMPYTLAISLQNSSGFYAIFLGMAALLLVPEAFRRNYAWIVFLNIGIFTAFFDYLTYPIATFGVPAALLLAMSSADETENKLRTMVGNGAAWCVGYGGMWGSKWILTACLTDYSIFSDAAAAFADRVSATDWNNTEFSVIRCIWENYSAFFFTPVTVLAFVFLLSLLARSRGRLLGSETAKTALPYVLLAFAPVVWYCFATNHSVVHGLLFTNKACVVTLLSALFCLTDCTLRAEKQCEG